jgi:hypothetical protein
LRTAGLCAFGCRPCTIKLREDGAPTSLELREEQVGYLQVGYFL